MDSRISRTIAAFRKSHSVFLDFSKDKLYLISRLYNIYLDFPKDVNSVELHRLCLVVLTLLLSQY